MPPWRLTPDEWRVVAPLVTPGPEQPARGRPRNPVTKRLVEACLYRHHHSRSAGTGRSFGWNTLPASFGVSPPTANRQYNGWLSDGTWVRLWDKLLTLRRAVPASYLPDGFASEPGKVDSPLRSPVAPVVVWMELAYRHFDDLLFGGCLPQDMVITLETRPRAGKITAFFCACGWQSPSGGRSHHIMVSARAWAEGAEAVLSALLHEAVHARCHQLRLPDTSDRQYHNRHFRDTALVSGLRCGPRNPVYGYAKTELDERGRTAVRGFLEQHHFPGDPGESVTG